MRRDLGKELLYESVKKLLETEAKHIHLHQHKLFTLFSIAFQYLLYRSTKDVGAYIIRVQDSSLVEKLARKAKDQSSRRFVQSLLLPRKLKYGGSTFYLDFFNFQSWNMTNEIPESRLKGALIIQGGNKEAPMTEVVETEEEVDPVTADLPKNYHLTSLLNIAPKTITIAFEEEFEDLTPISFDFIKKEKAKTVGGVTLSDEVDWDNID